MKAIQIENCRYFYPGANDEAAVDGVNLEINKGEFVAIIGQNGSGKSSVAKLINALIQPESGTVKIFDMDTNDESCLWEIRRRAGMVFQNPDNQLVATMVEDDVAFGPENIGIPPKEIRSRVDKALAMVKMSEFTNRATHMLSGGQKQRIAIAGVLALMPDIIIMDEPTAMLDPIGRREVLDTIMMLNKECGITVVLITHFMEEAALADKIFVMGKGKVIMEGTPAEVFCEVEKIIDLGLNIPATVDLAYRLRNKGMDIDLNIFKETNLVNEICRLI